MFADAAVVFVDAIVAVKLMSCCFGCVWCQFYEKRVSGFVGYIHAQLHLRVCDLSGRQSNVVQRNGDFVNNPFFRKFLNVMFYTLGGFDLSNHYLWKKALHMFQFIFSSNG